MKTGISKIVLTAAIFITIVASAHADQSPQAARGNNALSSLVIPRDELAYGRSYGEWAAAWWQWVLSIPSDAHPLLNTADCTTGQSGPVFFLGGTFVTGPVQRSCTVPSGKSLFFPILNELRASFPPPFVTINDQRSLNAADLDGATLGVDLGGKELRSLNTDFRVQSVTFDVTLPDNNLLGIPTGAYSVATDDGYYVMLKPLKPGNYVLHITGSDSLVQLDVTYNLTISK